MNDLSSMGWESDAQFAELSEEGRRKVRARCCAIERILKAKPKGHAIAREANELGICGSAMRRLVTVYVRSGGDWHSMIDRRIDLREESGAVPETFWDFLKTVCLENQRGSRVMFRKIATVYHSKATRYQFSKDGAVVELWPGYIDERGFHYRPEPMPKTGLPRGWSERNFYHHGPDKLERTLARQGPIAASSLLPMQFSTRANLKPGQFYVFDDRWLDEDCIIPPRMATPVRSIELSAGDVFSGKTVSWDLFPLVEDNEGRREQIKAIHMRLLLVDLLCVKGFHRGGVTLLVEHGTAAIPHELECLLCTLSGGVVEERDVIKGNRMVREKVIVKAGLIRVDRSGIQGGKSFGGGYPTLGKGNFRFKAGWESTHALKHTELADLPGQTGKNERMEPVEELHGRRDEAIKLMTVALGERPEVAKVLHENCGFLSFRNLYWAVDRVFKRIDAWTGHTLEGWADAGLMREEFRTVHDEDAWQAMSMLADFPEAQRAAIHAFIRTTDWCTQVRRLSRQEAWDKGASELTRLPIHCAPQIYGAGDEISKVRTVREDNVIQVVDDAVGDDPMFFSAVARTADGQMKKLDPRGSYRTWINPLHKKTLLVGDLDGRYIGVCQFERIDRGDEEAFQRNAGRVAAEKTEIIREPLRRMRLRNRHMAAKDEKIVNALSGGPVTDAERDLAADRAARAAAKSVPALPVQDAASDDSPPDFSVFHPQE